MPSAQGAPMRQRRILWQSLVVLFLLILGGGVMVTLSGLRSSPKGDEEQVWRPVVQVRSLEPDHHPRRILSHGSLQPRQILPLRSTMAGIIDAQTPRWSSGDRVAAGQELIHIDAPEIDAALALATAELQRLQAETARLQTQRSSDQELLSIEQHLLDISQQRLADDLQAAEQGSLSGRQLQQQQEHALQAERSVRQRQQALAMAEAQLAMLRAQNDAAQARLEEAQRQHQRLRLRAPFAGVIRQAPFAIGQMVNPGDVVLEISDAAPREVHLSVDQHSWWAFLGAEVEAAWEATEVRFLPAGGDAISALTGRLLRQEAVVERGQRLIQVVARLDEDAPSTLRLPDGSFGRIELLGSSHYGFRLPYAAVSNGQVWVVDDTDTVAPRSLQGLQRLDADYWLLPAEDGGFSSGERLVLRPTPDLVPGLQVIVQEADAKDQQP
ncbi:MAG: HlyD family efflux transporter periplasmic adaptor subunit [Planctomycetota bacterium]|nr:MAG: HlyD family efflux transporter periplasmic adaptor subunit [Planctomycetota bacterium]